MIREYTFLSSTRRTLRKSDHILAISNSQKFQRNALKKEHKLLQKAQDPKTNGNKGGGRERALLGCVFGN